MKGFQLAPVENVNDEKSHNNGNANVNGYGDINEIKIEKEASRPANETPKQRFQRVARQVVAQSTAHKWTMVLQGTLKNSQIGRSSQDTAKNLQQLGKAIEESKKLILHVPSNVSGRNSPIGVEFEDEKAETLLELLNQITEELSLAKPDAPGRRVNVEEVKKKFLQPQKLPVTTKPTTNKDTSSNSKQTLSATKAVTTRSQTLPEIQTTKKAGVNKPDINNQSTSKKLNELTLSAGRLNSTSSVKKAAPTAPGRAKPYQPSATHTPFSVELGKAGRKSGYTNKALVTATNVDFNVVDLDDYDDSAMMDDISQFSSDVPEHWK